MIQFAKVCLILNQKDPARLGSENFCSNSSPLQINQIQGTIYGAFSRLFNLHPEKWFEGYPVKSIQIFYRVPPEIFLG